MQRGGFESQGRSKGVVEVMVISLHEMEVSYNGNMLARLASHDEFDSLHFYQISQFSPESSVNYNYVEQIYKIR